MIPESISYHLPYIPQTLLMSGLVWLIIGLGSFFIIKTARMVPGPWQLVLETVVEYVCNLADELIGSEAHKFYPLFLGLFMYILIGNLVGLVPGLYSPTADPAVTFGLALMVFGYFVFLGFKHNGLKYLKQFSGPPLPWFLFPISVLLIFIEVITFFTRPFSLGLRLFCNIFSKELFLQILAFLLLQFLFSQELREKWFAFGPLGLRPFILILGIVIGAIQALVFTILSMSYVAGAIKVTEHE